MGARVTFRMPDGYRMRFHPSAISAAIWYEPEFRQDDLDVCRKLLRPGDTYVDVGANVGQLALVGAGRVGATGRVLAIEAHPRTFGFLKDNLALNPDARVEALNVAVGATEGRVSFTSLRLDDQNHVSAQNDSGPATSVAVARLDSLCPPGRVRLLKIDVEGFELHVLEGATDVLARCDCLYIEESQRNLERYGGTVSQLRAMLTQAGFGIFAHEAKSLTADPGFPAADASQNLLAVRPECLDEVRRALTQ